MTGMCEIHKRQKLGLGGSMTQYQGQILGLGQSEKDFMTIMRSEYTLVHRKNQTDFYDFSLYSSAQVRVCS